MPPTPDLATTDLICLSHLRWDFVFQRPQHLMSRCAERRRVFFFEEPVYERDQTPRLTLNAAGGVTVVTPQLPQELPVEALDSMLQGLLTELIHSQHISDFILWYYTPMAIGFTRHLTPSAVVYDCMDELAAFKGASALLETRELDLMKRASLVLTGGHSLYEAKQHLHPNIHPFPSSVDAAHFERARRMKRDPPDQSPISHPRLGYFGVLDERLDLELIAGLARARPDWQIVMIGPVAKIDPDSLPTLPNIHYLGAKSYKELPRYVARWDVALMPFARNDATKYISPTKTPEYLAAGRPVVSTSIRDVVRPYGQLGLVRIADDVPAFVAACAAALEEHAAQRIERADAFLAQTSWDGTWHRIELLLDDILRGPGDHDDQTLAEGLTL